MILGEPSYVREMLDAGLGRISSAGGQLMERWGESAFLGESFWLAGSPEDTFASAFSASPEMTAVVDSIQIGQVGDEVEVSLAVPYEILRGLSERAVETHGEEEEQEQDKEQSLEQPPVSRD